MRSNSLKFREKWKRVVHRPVPGSSEPGQEPGRVTRSPGPAEAPIFKDRNGSNRPPCSLDIDGMHPNIGGIARR